MGMVDRLSDLKNKSVLAPNLIIIAGTGIVGACGVGLLLLYGGGGGGSSAFSTLVNFFWPLLLSTGFFLVAVLLLFKISPPPASESVGDSVGEELIDYVAYQHHPHHNLVYPSDEDIVSEKQPRPDPSAEE